MKSECQTPRFLNPPDLGLVLFGGKGGVGKTTCAVAAALNLATNNPAKHYLLISTDPAHSLADSLGQTDIPSNLSVEELDAAAELAAFNRKHRQQFNEIAKRGTFLDDTDIQQFLNLSLPGMDELMALLALINKKNSGKFATICVDTAPTGHTLNLLTMPDLIHKWLHALDTLLGKHRYMRMVFHGHYTEDDLDRFLLDLDHQAKTAQQALTDVAGTAFVLVTNPDALSIAETARYLAQLRALNIAVTDLLINKIYPPASCSLCRQAADAEQAVLNTIPEQLQNITTWTLPLFADEMQGDAALGSLYTAILPFQPPAATSVAPAPIGNPAYAIALTRSLPVSAAKTVWILAGKGGVGKTTLASALATRFSTPTGSGRTLLFSADPAHSLSDSFARPIASKPTRISANLDVMQLDGSVQLAALKTNYAEELQQFLLNLSDHLDFTFDRKVMESLLDLSPPGLDELMAVIEAADYLFAGTYDRLIIDSAPTGHLVRLLEMPELIRQWLAVFFELFLKYKSVFNLPSIAAQMVAMSKKIKKLIELLHQPETTGLLVVTIPTTMAFNETRDLVSHCQTLQIPIHGLIINRVTTANDCPFCTRRCNAEQDTLLAIARHFSELVQTTLYYQPLQPGLNGVTQLGAALFSATGMDRD